MSRKVGSPWRSAGAPATAVAARVTPRPTRPDESPHRRSATTQRTTWGSAQSAMETRVAIQSVTSIEDVSLADLLVGLAADRLRRVSVVRGGMVAAR